MDNTILYFHTLQTVHLPLAFLSHLSSLLPFLTIKRHILLTRDSDTTTPNAGAQYKFVIPVFCKQSYCEAYVGYRITSHKKVFRIKASACRDGTLKNQPNKTGMTPQCIHTIPTSCAILPTMHTKLSTCTYSLFTPTK